MKVKPGNWDELYEALKRKVVDSTLEIDYSELPNFPATIPIDEIVAAQPLAVPSSEGSFWVRAKRIS